ncbi:hypothetical protein F5141DRAFT_1127376 [Pisolithus sp. B1]|nr:hypothetical protein F5141DRAFT_1127376 [Pisolithus sp. B1]
MAPSKKTWGWLHRRTESFKAQSQSLISTSRPVSYLHPAAATAGGSPVQQSHEQDGRGSTVPTNSSSHPHANMSSVPQPKEKDNLPPPVVQTGPRDSSDAENGTYSLKMNNLKELLMREIDGSRASAPLTAYCFMTGFMYVPTLSALRSHLSPYVLLHFVRSDVPDDCADQLALALARLFNGAHDYSFHIADRQALCSVLSFIFGAFIGRLGDKIGCKTRLWMTLGTFIQALFTMAAAIAIWKSGQPSVSDSRDDPAWGNVASFVCVGFMSASMGLQGIMGKRLNTQFTTTVVLTTTWCELMTEPQLFHFRRLVRSRDHKVMAILFLFIGGFTGRAILDKIGSAGTLGVGAGVRFLITLSWLFVPVKKTSKN